MLKSCHHCGRVHDRTYQCASKPKRIKESNEINRFRWSSQWKKKSREIRDRDNHICQVCMRKLFNTTIQYNYNNLEVHHIESIAENWDKRLNDGNLISLCAYHHKMADNGDIPKNILVELVEQF